MARRKQLENTGDWFDIKSTTTLARWKGRVGGARWGLWRTRFRLLRTEQGNLVLEGPGFVLGLPYYMHVAMNLEYLLLTPEEAVDTMAKFGGLKHARRLFPDLVNNWEAALPQGRQV